MAARPLTEEQATFDAAAIVGVVRDHHLDDQALIDLITAGLLVTAGTITPHECTGRLHDANLAAQHRRQSVKA